MTELEKNGRKKSDLPEGFAERLARAEGSILFTGADGVVTARVPADTLLDFMGTLKTGPGMVFEMLTDLCSVDEQDPADVPREEGRYDVVYHLRNLGTGTVVRIKTTAEGDPPTVPSVISHYPGANWNEREVYDMMGIHFEGHPDLKRILMPLEYEGYPLRKDFPLEGIEPDRLFKRQYPDYKESMEDT